MDMYKAVQLAANAGKMILENGGETYRVEETIIRICDAYGCNNAESFVMPTGIMISATDYDGKIISVVKRIKNRTTNLEKVSAVNDLSRNITSKNLSIHFVENELIKISKLSTYNLAITLIFAAITSSSFTLLFGGTYQDFILSFFIGIVIKYLAITLSNINTNEFFINALGGAIASLFALMSLKLGIVHSIDKIIIGSIMLLVPGITITNSIRDTISGDFVSGVSRGVEAFLVAIAIATGSGIVIKIWGY